MQCEYSARTSQSWRDTDDQELETRLSVIASEIIVTGELYEDMGETRERLKQDAIRREAEREGAETDRVIALGAARLKPLTGSADKFQRAKTVRTLVNSVIESSDENTDSGRVQRWKD